MVSKSRRIEGGERVGAVVARGEAEIGFQQISELLPISGIDHVTPLPAEVQKLSIFSAGVALSTRDSDGAHALIRFLASPQAVRAIKNSGLEPIANPRGLEIKRFYRLGGYPLCHKLERGECHSAKFIATRKIAPGGSVKQLIDLKGRRVEQPHRPPLDGDDGFFIRLVTMKG